MASFGFMSGGNGTPQYPTGTQLNLGNGGFEYFNLLFGPSGGNGGVNCSNPVIVSGSLGGLEVRSDTNYGQSFHIYLYGTTPPPGIYTATIEFTFSNASDPTDTMPISTTITLTSLQVLSVAITDSFTFDENLGTSTWQATKQVATFTAPANTVTLVKVGGAVFTGSEVVTVTSTNDYETDGNITMNAGFSAGLTGVGAIVPWPNAGTYTCDYELRCPQAVNSPVKFSVTIIIKTKPVATAGGGDTSTTGSGNNTAGAIDTQTTTNAASYAELTKAISNVFNPGEVVGGTGTRESVVEAINKSRDALVAALDRNTAALTALGGTTSNGISVAEAIVGIGTIFDYWKHISWISIERSTNYEQTYVKADTLVGAQGRSDLTQAHEIVEQKFTAAVKNPSF